MILLSTQARVNEIAVECSSKICTFEELEQPMTVSYILDSISTELIKGYNFLEDSLKGQEDEQEQRDPWY